MRKQRFAYSLPNKVDSECARDSDNLSVLSNSCFHSENVPYHVISPEIIAPIPYYFHQYPIYETPDDTITHFPEYFNPLLATDFTILNEFNPYYDVNYMYGSNDASFFDTVNNGDQILPENITPFTDTTSYSEAPLSTYAPSYFDTSSLVNIPSYNYESSYTDTMSYIDTSSYTDTPSYINSQSLITIPSYTENSSYIDAFSAMDIAPCTDTTISKNCSSLQYDEPETLPSITNFGVVTIQLNHLIRVDISPAKGVYLVNPPANCIAAVNGKGNKSCILHPNGKVYQVGQYIHINTLDRKAKISERGIIFSSTNRCLSYLVDDSGTKTTSEKIFNLNDDLGLQVFHSDSVVENVFEECYKMVNEAQFKRYRNGDNVWLIGGLRIKQDKGGEIKVTINSNNCCIQTSPTTGKISIKSFAHETNIGRFSGNYFIVRKGNKQVTASQKSFTVKNGTQKAGFNNYGKVVLF